MIYCAELDKEYANKGDMFKALKDNAHKIIQLKKANIYKSHEKGNKVCTKFNKSIDAQKNINGAKPDHIYAVINTTNYLDSHGDVHIKGIWDKSIGEQQGKVFYVADHSLDLNSVIAWKSDVRMFTQDIPWSVVGKSFEGNTQALIFEIHKDKIMNNTAAEIISKGLDVENSVRMQYVQIKLAVNDDSQEFKEEKSNYDTYIESISNKEVAEENGYFWVVKEAKIQKEGSMVLFGSNDATRVESIKDIQPSEDTDKNEPPKGTQTTNNLLI